MDGRSITLLADIEKAIIERREFFNPTFGVYVVPQVECARYLRERGVNACAPSELDWLYSLPAGQDAVCIDEAQRVAEELRQRGIVNVFGAWTPSPFRYLSEWLRSRAAMCPLLPVSDFLSMLTDTALAIKAEPSEEPTQDAPTVRVVRRG